ncbi:hypothetical protein [Nonomuraea jiangxiensis]|nr:hypothetical protein [Nonomuraea jiangxiensis]
MRNGRHEGYTGDMTEGFATDLLWDESRRELMIVGHDPLRG